MFLRRTQIRGKMYFIFYELVKSARVESARNSFQRVYVMLISFVFKAAKRLGLRNDLSFHLLVHWLLENGVILRLMYLVRTLTLYVFCAVNTNNARTYFAGDGMGHSIRFDTANPMPGNVVLGTRSDG